tara:strand:- start:17488 stop:18246 length:759 start_codon:yes stop_codon:yes gene_type:complete
MIIFPYKPGSNSARDLARELGVRRISHRNSTFRGRPNKMVINWGASRVPEQVALCTIINAPETVARASDKLQFFQNADCRKPDFTTDLNQAIGWFNEGVLLVERHVLNGHSGDGIRLSGREIGVGVHEAPLYTKYVKKRNEYRVHVFRGEVIDVQRKARRQEVPDNEVDWRIRNHDNGFVFARNGDALGDVPNDCLVQAVSAVTSLGLDFGAVDVVYNERESAAYCLEVNTAPGLAGTTVESYAQAFRQLEQ